MQIQYSPIHMSIKLKNLVNGRENESERGERYSIQ